MHPTFNQHLARWTNRITSVRAWEVDPLVDLVRQLGASVCAKQMGVPKFGPVLTLATCIKARCLGWKEEGFDEHHQTSNEVTNLRHASKGGIQAQS